MTVSHIMDGMKESFDASGFSKSKRPAAEIDRRRASRALVNAWLCVDRKHITPAAILTTDKPLNVLERVVLRANQLEGELLHRLTEIDFTSEPTEKEEASRKKKTGYHPLPLCEWMWSGEPSVAGDICIDVLTEILYPIEKEKKRATRSEHKGTGRPHSGKAGARNLQPEGCKPARLARPRPANGMVQQESERVLGSRPRGVSLRGPHAKG